jgi:hypothetical protein
MDSADDLASLGRPGEHAPALDAYEGAGHLHVAERRDEARLDSSPKLRNCSACLAAVAGHARDRLSRSKCRLTAADHRRVHWVCDAEPDAPKGD